MNTLRTNFILPNSHKILITPYWLFVRYSLESVGGVLYQRR